MGTTFADITKSILEENNSIVENNITKEASASTDSNSYQEVKNELSELGIFTDDVVEVSRNIEKIAQEIDEIDDMETLVKVASEAGNDDIANLVKIASLIGEKAAESFIAKVKTSI